MNRHELLTRLQGFEWNDFECKRASRAVPEDACLEQAGTTTDATVHDLDFTVHAADFTVHAANFPNQP